MPTGARMHAPPHRVAIAIVVIGIAVGVVRIPVVVVAVIIGVVAVPSISALVVKPVVEIATVVETTAMGAAYLAGLQIGFWKNSAEIKKIRRVDRVFRPKMKDEVRKNLWAGWKRAVGQVLAK